MRKDGCESLLTGWEVYDVGICPRTRYLLGNEITTFLLCPRPPRWVPVPSAAPSRYLDESQIGVALRLVEGTWHGSGSRHWLEQALHGAPEVAC